MGIKDYHKWMTKTHPDAFKKKWLDYYDHLYIDINYALHYVHYGTKNQNEIIFKFFKFIEKMMILFNPLKSIIIANDGPAPIAKLLLQRNRRINISKEIDNLEASSLIFTPGTEFMNSIQQKLEIFMEKIKKANNIRVDYMIGCEGEAEIKLKEKIMQNNQQNNKDTHILISNDADIVAMFGSFDIRAYSKIFICCDIKNIEILSMCKLMDSHTTKFGITKNFGLDFTFMSILVGNDYLPKISYSDLTKLWESYKTWHSNYKEGLIIIQNNNKFAINIDFFVKILNGIITKTKIHFINTFKLNNYNPLLYENYIEGTLWCLDMYNKGRCDRYNYMYSHTDNPHPLGIITNLLHNPNCAMFINKKYPSINPNLYAILVFPKKALSLVNDKYHKFAKSQSILYDEEVCKTCISMNTKMSEYKKTETKYKELAKELKFHKSTHDNIEMDTIEEIVVNFTEEFTE